MIRQAVRKFLVMPSHIKTRFARNYFGYNSLFGNDIQNKLFFKWIKENNKQMAFVLEILEIEIEEEPFLK